MSLRTLPERIFQTLCFEALGLLIVAPVYSLVFDTSAAQGLTVIAALALAVVVWTPCHNAMFDYFDWHLNRRLASDRPPLLRVFHALSQEISSVMITLPLLLWLGGLTFVEAVAVDAGLTLFYAAYTFVFHVVYDRWRPVGRCAALGVTPCGSASTA